MATNNLLDALKKRGLIDQISSDNLVTILEKPTRVYGGFDPSAPSLHLGNLQAIMLLAWFQRYGHPVVALIGGATGMIGDPSGKSQERQLLSEEVLVKNVEGIKKNLTTILYQGPKPPHFVNNYDWFKGFGLLDFLRDVGKYFRMGVMLSKESVKLRLASEEGLSYTEFSYQLLQGYDFLYLYEKEGVILQIGGSDQWGNITAGIDLVRKKTGEEVYGITMPLLTKADGTKFGKSESGAIWLSEEMLSAYDFYQHLMRVRDDEVFTLLKRLTFLELSEIAELESKIHKGEIPPTKAQETLASEVTRLVHGEAGLEKARRITESAKPGHKIALNPDFFIGFSKEVAPIKASMDKCAGKKIADLLVEWALFPSKAEVRRMIKNGGLMLNEIKVADPEKILNLEDIFEKRWLLVGIGKKNKQLVEFGLEGKSES
jgi:tyrosyl-tRNA synthetase